MNIPNIRRLIRLLNSYNEKNNSYFIRRKDLAAPNNAASDLYLWDFTQ